MVIRRLRVEEWGKLDEVFKTAFEAAAPPVDGTGVIIVEDQGKIAGFFCVRLTPWAEMWVDKQYRGSFALPKLLDKFREEFPDVTFCLAQGKTQKMEEFLARLGLEEMTGKLYRWSKESYGESNRISDPTSKSNVVV